jgi:hypothetical protein
MPPRDRVGTAEVMIGGAPGAPLIVEDVFAADPDAPSSGTWHVQAWFELRDGAPRVTEIRIRSAGGSSLEDAQGPAGPKPEYPFVPGRSVPSGGITGDVLRKVSFNALHDAIGKDNASAETLAHHGLDPDQDFLRVRRPGRRGRDDGFYAAWADRYVSKCMTTRRPLPELAQEWHYKESTIRDFVEQARKRGLLVGGSPGRAGGVLSEKAEEILQKGER